MKVVTVVAVSLLASLAEGVFEWSDCGDPTNRIATIDRLEVTPDPLILGQDVKVGVDFTVLRTLPNDAVLSLELWRSIGVLDVPLPPCTSNGRCKMHAYSVFRNWAMACDYIRSNRNGTCDEPLTPGKLTGSNYIEHVPVLNTIASMVAQGTYKLRFRLVDSKANELACLYIVDGLASGAASSLVNYMFGAK
ncbi:hypothetical protein HDE_00331 [Halotydeus destructor]|nr:hypothetical protein HDE_00331 [Halotydeus destructor]